MDDQSRNGSSHGTQIDDLPTFLFIDILSRLPTTSLRSCRAVSKSWYLFSSDPRFVKLHPARPPTYQVSLSFPLPDSEFTFLNSFNGFLCLESSKSRGEIYLCNPILGFGEYLTIPTGNTDTETTSGFGFSVRSNRFKVLQINSPKHIAPYKARIYTIGDGTRQWKSIGIAPSCPGSYDSSIRSFVNGSIHWVDEQTHQIVYFNFDSELFGSLPSPPPLRDGRSAEFKAVRMCVLAGSLCFFAIGPFSEIMELWIMKEYGVEESWTNCHPKLKPPELISSSEIHLGVSRFPYNPYIISLQDIGKGEKYSVLSTTRFMMGCSRRLSDYLLRSRNSGGVRIYSDD